MYSRPARCYVDSLSIVIGPARLPVIVVHSFLYPCLRLSEFLAVRRCPALHCPRLKSRFIAISFASSCPVLSAETFKSQDQTGLEPNISILVSTVPSQSQFRSGDHNFDLDFSPRVCSRSGRFRLGSHFWLSVIGANTAEKLEGTSGGVDYQSPSFSFSIHSSSTLIAPPL